MSNIGYKKLKVTRATGLSEFGVESDITDDVTVSEELDNDDDDGKRILKYTVRSIDVVDNYVNRITITFTSEYDDIEVLEKTLDLTTSGSEEGRRERRS